MIEVEKKFLPSEEVVQRLTQGAEFLGEKVLTDIYYDGNNYSLTTQDIWLRRRNGTFELKLPLQEANKTTRTLDKYEELDTEEAIREALDIPVKGSLAEDLEAAGFESFCTIVTTRQEYRIGEFIIDLNHMDFGYSIGEIEMLVSTQGEMEAAEGKILAFARKHGIDTSAPVRGKVIEWLFRNNPKHYKALIDAGVV